MYRILQAKYIIFVLLAALSFAVIGEAYYVLILSNQKSMTVSFNYSGAELGLNPDGSRFNISELTNDEILNEAKAGLELEKSDNADIRSRLFYNHEVFPKGYGKRCVRYKRRHAGIVRPHNLLRLLFSEKQACKK